MKIFAAALILIGSCLTATAQQLGTGWFGAGHEDLSKEEAGKLGWDAPRGAKVTNLNANGPAESAGLQAGDILVTLDGAEIANDDSLTDMLLAKTPDTVIRLAVRRAGLEKQVSVTLGTRPVRRADDRPQLTLDTGGHQANIVDIVITPDGKQLVSASNDKTVRVWDIASGKTVRTIRGESAPGNWGTIYAMSLSQDGRWLAVGGYLSEADLLSGTAIRLYDFASGKLVRVIKGHRNVVFALAFSRDGKRLISGSGDKTAIIWDVATGQQLFRLAGHSDKIKAVAFNKDGTRAVTGGSDQALRLWNATDGKQIAEMTEHKAIALRENGWKGDVNTVAFSPDDRMIASGSADGRVLLWEGSTGAFLRQLAFPGGMLLRAINSLSFSPDGRSLLFASEGEGCHFYEIDSGKNLWDGKQARPRCTGGAAFGPDGQLAVASYNSMIHLLDPRTNAVLKTLQGSGAKIFATGFAKDGRSIAWGTDSALQDGSHELHPLVSSLRLPFDGAPLAGPVRMSMEPVASSASAKAASDHPRVTTGPGASSRTKPVDDDKYLRRSVKQGSFSVDFKHVDKFLINMRFLEIMKNGELQTQIDLRGDPGLHPPLAFTPDGQTILIGRNAEIEAYDLSGRQLGNFIGYLGAARDLVPSADGRYLVSGGVDETVRLWNLQTRELIVSLFHGTDGEWVVWTPQGYYASSPNGDRIVGWQINKGPDQAAEYVTANQLRNKFYRPDIVDRAIVLASATKAVEEADPGRAGGFQLSDLAQRLPPKLAVLSPRDGSGTSNGRAMIDLALAETAGDPVNRFDVFVNDTKVTTAAKREGGDVSFEVPLAQGHNRIRVVARSQADLLGEAQLSVVQRGEGALDKRNTLFIVAIGADKYPQLPNRCGQGQNAPCDLSFAGADAKVFAATVEKQMGGQHMRVVKRILVNGAGGEFEPTRANVENALDTLLQAKDNDTVAVFIAGHGLYDVRTGYQFLPTDARFADGANLASSSIIKWSVLEGAIQSARGRRLLFVDTCRSTNAFNPRLMKDASDDAIVAFSATNTQQDALELPSLGHGVFTNAVVKGLNGAADIAQEQEVRVFDLGAYVEREVRKLTKGMQTPDFYKNPGAENFVLARLSNSTAAIPPADTRSAAGETRPAPQGDRPIPPARSEPSPPPEKSAVAQSVSPDIKSAAVSISPSEEAERLKSGQAALALYDIAGARLIFSYLARRGSAAGAYQLAQTYDPRILGAAPLGAWFKPDEKVAEIWYLKAAELGHPEARNKLAGKK